MVIARIRFLKFFVQGALAGSLLLLGGTQSYAFGINDRGIKQAFLMRK